MLASAKQHNQVNNKRVKTDCHAFNRCWRKAVSIRKDLLDPENVGNEVGGKSKDFALAGRLFLDFLSPSTSLIWSCSSNDCGRVTSVCDIVVRIQFFQNAKEGNEEQGGVFFAQSKLLVEMKLTR